MPRGSRTDPAFRKWAAAEFSRILAEHRLTQAAAARELGVKRQAVNQYLKQQTTPSRAVLAKAHQIWGLRVRYKEHDFSGSIFGLPPSPRLEPLQLKLFQQASVTRDGTVVIKIGSGRTSEADITLEVRIRDAG